MRNEWPINYGAQIKEALGVVRSSPPSSTGSLPVDEECPASGDEVISVSSRDASEGDHDYVSPSLKKQVDALSAYEDRMRRLHPKACDGGRARAAFVRARGQTFLGFRAASFSRTKSI